MVRDEPFTSLVEPPGVSWLVRATARVSAEEICRGGLDASRSTPLALNRTPEIGRGIGLCTGGATVCVDLENAGSGDSSRESDRL